MKIYKIDTRYIQYLQKFDKHVMYPKERKHERPYIGIVFTIGTFLYFAPLSSNNQNKHHWTIPTFGKPNGSIFLINMIPIPLPYSNELIAEVDIDQYFFSENASEEAYGLKLFLQSEKLKDAKFITVIAQNAINLYRLQKYNKKYSQLCCNFPLLEKISLNCIYLYTHLYFLITKLITLYSDKWIKDSF